MRQREVIQESRIDIGTSGTKTFNLDYTDPITQLDLYIEATNGSGGNLENPPERCISKVEIVDGGEVLWDLPGEVMFAAFCHDAEQVPYSEREEAQSTGIRQQLPIRFGRWLWDPVYAFDPRKHKNPQLRFTFNEAAVNTAGTTGYVSDSFTFTLHVRLMEGAPAPKAFLSYRTVESFTTVAGGARRVEMPTDKVIRYLLTRAYEVDIALYTSLTNFKLSADGGKYVPFDLPARDMMNRMCESFEPLQLPLHSLADDLQTKETWMGIQLPGSICGYTTGHIFGGVFYLYGTVYCMVQTGAGVSVTGNAMYIVPIGWAIHNTLIYAFGDRNVPADWFDPRSFNKLDYFVTDANAGADCDIAIQQVFPY